MRITQVVKYSRRREKRKYKTGHTIVHGYGYNMKKRGTFEYSDDYEIQYRLGYTATRSYGHFAYAANFSAHMILARNSGIFKS